MSLKRKKAYEKQIEQIDNSISRVNEQQMMLENQRTTAETVLALQQGVRANKATMQVFVRSVHSANQCCNQGLLGNTAVWLQPCCSFCPLWISPVSAVVIYQKQFGVSCVAIECCFFALQELNIDDVDKTMDEISEAQDQMQQMNDVLSQPIGAAADMDEDELAAELAVGCAFALSVAESGWPFYVAAFPVCPHTVEATTSQYKLSAFCYIDIPYVSVVQTARHHANLLSQLFR